MSNLNPMEPLRVFEPSLSHDNERKLTADEIAKVREKTGHLARKIRGGADEIIDELFSRSWSVNAIVAGYQEEAKSLDGFINKLKENEKQHRFMDYYEDAYVYGQGKWRCRLVGRALSVALDILLGETEIQ